MCICQMNKIILSLLFVFINQSVIAQKSSTYQVKDAITKEPVAYCTIFYTDKENKRHTTTTSPNGNFQIVGDSIATIEITHIQYETKIIRLSELEMSEVIFLTEKSVQLGTVTVYSTYRQTNTGNIYTYTPAHSASSISIIGEPDILRHISSLPSVSQGIEGTLGLFVRGSNNGSNGIYFNDVPMYVTSHLMGMFSVFSPELINETKFFLGGLPSERGNQSSSLLDISVKRNYGTKFTKKITLSPYMAGVYTSVPIINDKFSIQLSGRTSFLPYIINSFQKDSEKMHIQIYDFTSILDYKVSEKNYIDAMIFSTNDYFSYEQNKSSYTQNWRGTTGKLGWKTFLLENANIYSWVYYTSTKSAQKNIKYDNENTNIRRSQLGIESKLTELSLNTKMECRLNEKLNINTGFSLQKQFFTPTNEKYVLSGMDILNKNEEKSNIFSFFGEVIYNPSDIFKLKAGMRPSVQNMAGYKSFDFDAHILGNIQLTNEVGMEISFDKLQQYYHIFEGLPTGWSLNVMSPSSAKIPSEKTFQGYIGAFFKKNINNTLLNISLGGYHRKMENIVSYINGMNAFGFNTSSWENEIDTGNGFSHGLEFSGSLQGKNLGCTIAYTLSESKRKFNKINNGEIFPFKFNRRHILNIQNKFTISKYVNKKGKEKEHIFNSVLSFSSGNKATIPIGSYQGMATPYWENLSSGRVFPSEFYENIYDRQLMSSKNGFTMEDYFRIDVAYTVKTRKNNKESELSFSIFNLLNRQNPYTYFYEEGEWKQLSIMPIIPAIRWTKSW